MAAQSTARREFEGNIYTGYEATQVQRKIEAEIRKSKERAVLAQAAEDDLLRKVEQQRISQLIDKYTDLCKVFGLPFAADRMQVSGFRPVR